MGDPLAMSLDDYIKERKIVSRRPQPNYRGYRPRPSSQQWRLGRNGPRLTKRLQRAGPLRPWNKNFPHYEQKPEGLPFHVWRRKTSGNLPIESVFNRVGWNPLYIIARNRVQIARDFIARKLCDYQPRRRAISTPMSGTRRFRSQGYNRFQFQQFLRTQELQYQRRQLRQKLYQNRAPPNNFYQRPFHRAAPQPVRQPFEQPMEEYVPLSPPEDDFPQDTSDYNNCFVPPVREEPVRSVSPEGSIIHELSSNRAYNPFSNPSFNPFSARSASVHSAHSAHSTHSTRTSAYANPFSRPAQQTSAYSSTQQYSSPPEYSSAPQYNSTQYNSSYSRTQFNNPVLSAGGSRYDAMMN